MKNSLPFLPKDGPFDPTLFGIDWSMVLEVLTVIIVLSFLVERALAPLFESRWFLIREVRRNEANRKGSYKPLIAVILSAAVCYIWQFDAISIIFHREHMTVFGAFVTGAVIAGGSKASIKLFHDVLNVKSSYYDEVHKDTQRNGAKKSPANQAKIADPESPAPS